MHNIGLLPLFGSGFGGPAWRRLRPLGAGHDLALAGALWSRCAGV